MQSVLGAEEEIAPLKMEKMTFSPNFWAYEQKMPTLKKIDEVPLPKWSLILPITK